MKKGLLISVLFLLCISLPNFAFASDLTDDYFDIAVEYFNQNDYAKAMEYLGYILQIEPDNLPALTLKNKICPPPKPEPEADAVPISSTTQDAVLTVVKSTDVSAVQIDVGNVVYDADYYNTKGQEAYQKKDFDSAIEYFFKAINIDSKNAQAYNSLGLTYQAKNSTHFAIKYFKLANSIKKSYTEYFNRSKKYSIV